MLNLAPEQKFMNVHFEKITDDDHFFVHMKNLFDEIYMRPVIFLFNSTNMIANQLYRMCIAENKKSSPQSL